MDSTTMQRSSFHSTQNRVVTIEDGIESEKEQQKETLEGDGLYVTQNYHVAQIVKYLGIFSVKSPEILSFLKCAINLLSNEGMVLLRSLKTHREMAI